VISIFTQILISLQLTLIIPAQHPAYTQGPALTLDQSARSAQQTGIRASIFSRATPEIQALHDKVSVFMPLWNNLLLKARYWLLRKSG
jgi:hypothetical protein